MRAGLVQLSVTDDPDANLPVTLAMIRDAAAQGAEFVLTPEVTNCISSDRAHQARVLCHENDDPTLAAARAEAGRLGIWLLIGSLALRTHDADGRFANRSFLIGPDGMVVARYDKIHMFDVTISATEQYRESAGYRPGDRAVLTRTPFGAVGMTVCYDLRFPQLYRALAQAGAEILTVPAAFNDTTGAAHWETLLRARAIETGCFVLAPAQTGGHANHNGKPRRTHGHSLAVAPWGEVLADGGTGMGVTLVDLDLTEVERARSRVPSLLHDRPFKGPGT
jgi:predicted amidohydrolase